MVLRLKTEKYIRINGKANLSFNKSPSLRSWFMVLFEYVALKICFNLLREKLKIHANSEKQRIYKITIQSVAYCVFAEGVNVCGRN